MGRWAFGIVLIPIIVLLLGTFFYNAQVSSALTTGTPYNGHVVLHDPNQDFFGSNNSVPAYQNQTVGCESNNATHCGFQSIQLLTPNTIPTCLIETSLICFTNVLQGLGGIQPAAFAQFNGPASIYAVCVNVNNTGPTYTVFTVECNQDYSNGTAYPFALTSAYTNSSTVRNVYGCTYFEQNTSYVGYSASWAYWGCDFIPGARANATNPASRFGTLHVETPGNDNQTFGFIMAVNGTAFRHWGAAVGPGPTANVVDVGAELLLLENNQTALNAYDCLTQYASADITPDCHGFLSAASSTNAQTGNRNFGLALALGFAGDIFIILMGLGLGIGAGGLTFNFSLTPNSQGTRFFQTLGFSLLFWIVVLAESGPLIASLGFLGWGTGLIGLLTFILIVGIITQTLNVF